MTCVCHAAQPRGLSKLVGNEIFTNSKGVKENQLWLLFVSSFSGSSRLENPSSGSRSRDSSLSGSFLILREARRSGGRRASALVLLERKVPLQLLDNPLIPVAIQPFGVDHGQGASAGRAANTAIPRHLQGVSAVKTCPAQMSMVISSECAILQIGFRHCGANQGEMLF